MYSAHNSNNIPNYIIDPTSTIILAYRISSKERPGAHLKVSLRGEAAIRGGAHLQLCFFGGCSFDFVDIQTQSFPIVVSRHINATYEEIGNTRKMESVRKPYENEKDHKAI